MAIKMITRTIKVYTYTTGDFNPATMSVSNMKNHSFPYKLGARDRRELEKSVNSRIIAETTGEALYAMSIDDFIKYAKPVESADSEIGLEAKENA